MFLEREKIASIIDSLGFKIISRDILISRQPIFALAYKQDRLALIEFLKNGDAGFISDHVNWLKKNINLFISKYGLDSYCDFGLTCFCLNQQEFNLELPGLTGDTNFYSIEFNNKGGSLCQPFQNFTLNFSYFNIKLNSVTDKMDRKHRELFYAITRERPLIIREKALDYFLIEAGSSDYWVKFNPDFIWLHKGRAPFRPEKIMLG